MKKYIFLILIFITNSYASNNLYTCVHKDTPSDYNYCFNSLAKPTKLNTDSDTIFNNWIVFSTISNTVKSPTTQYFTLKYWSVSNGWIVSYGWDLSSGYPVKNQKYHFVIPENIVTQTNLYNGNDSLITYITDKVFQIDNPLPTEPEPEAPKDIETSNPNGNYNNLDDGKTTTWFDSKNNYYSYNVDTGILLVYDRQKNKSFAYNVGSGYVPGNSYNTGSLLQEISDKPTGIDTAPVDTLCSGFETLQEKMLCEINQGIKKLNQESNSSNSLNNLLQKYNANSNKNAQDINNNLKSIDNLIQTQNTINTSTNSKIESVNTKLNETNSNLDSIQSTLNDIKNNTSGSDFSITNPDSSSPNLDNYLKPDTTSNTNDLDSNTEDTDSLIDSLINTFTTFKTNITDSFTTINTQITDTQSLIINPTNIFKNIEVVNCPTTYEADFSSFGLGSQLVIVDYCHYMSYLNPIIYFFTYMMLMIGLITFTLKFIGVLL
ncbi:hypothetical protein ACIB15232_0947 [Aliarcobacter cibarius]|uniref:hypothetical protein n=1 Tax=Aliarcobacter cibarius TaxID=255507 RepID=UPI001248A365|nr:hypothetical protein [Aliarcobacter cibarius]QEZ89065.1 hypothetical protein ACIB15232_0947 [Aliarcobacter cibarius]